MTNIISLTDARAAPGLPAPNVVSIEAVLVDRWVHLLFKRVLHGSQWSGEVRKFRVRDRRCVEAEVWTPSRSAWFPAHELVVVVGGGDGPGRAA